MIKKFEEEIFWKDGFNGNAKGGFYFRSFDLNKFLEKLETSTEGGEIVGLKFEDNNVELIVKVSDQIKDE
jgi:hypothetical protein